MINPTLEDIGKPVVYSPVLGGRQEGVITSFNDYCIFVRYGVSVTSQATFREDLFWKGNNDD
mgnify:CR=1 FL=1